MLILIEEGFFDCNAWLSSFMRTGIQIQYPDQYAFMGIVPSLAARYLQDLAREIVDWRLEEYRQRLRTSPAGDRITCKVSHSSGRPIIRLPDRKQAAIPDGWQKVIADGEEYEADFRKVAVNCQ